MSTAIGAATSAPSVLNANTNNVNLTFQINDNDTGNGLEGAIVKATHQSNPSLNYESAPTDATGYTQINDIETAVRNKPGVPEGYELRQNLLIQLPK